VTTPDHCERAVAALGLPADWQVIVAVRPRRRAMAIEIRPGGTVAILVPPTAPPERGCSVRRREQAQDHSRG
jgi:predicted metal-dependent hydrolase